MTATYEIRKGDTAPCKLVSLVRGKVWGGTVDKVFVNFVCEGTHTYCAGVEARLEGEV